MMKKLLVTSVAIVGLVLFACASPALAADAEDFASSITAWSQVGIDPHWGCYDESSSTPEKVIDGDLGTWWQCDWYDTYPTPGVTNGTYEAEGPEIQESWGPSQGYPGWFKMAWPSPVYVTNVRIDWQPWDWDGTGGVDGPIYVANDGKLYADSTVTDTEFSEYVDNPNDDPDVGTTISTEATLTGGTEMGSFSSVNNGEGEPMFVDMDVTDGVMTTLVLWFPKWDNPVDQNLVQKNDVRIAEVTVTGYIGGDTDTDDDVDSTDLATLGLNWDPAGTGHVWADGDFDGDGDIDSADLAALSQNWAPAGYGTGHAPEPATIALIGLGTLGTALLRKRRR